MNGLVPTLTAGMDHGNTMPYIVAMRGRDKLNPSHRGKTTENYEQRLEINMSNCTNTLTSVQKDNLVLEKVLTEDMDKAGFLSRAEQSRAEQLNLYPTGNEERGHRDGDTRNSGSQLSYKRVPQGKGTRERQDKSDIDDGGYP